MNAYPIEMQRDLVICSFLTHNFIRSCNLYEEDEFYENIPSGDDEAFHAGNLAPQNDNLGGDANAVHAWRDGIAQRMWDQYEAYNAGNV